MAPARHLIVVENRYLCSMQQIVYSNNVEDTLDQLLASLEPASVHVVTDANVEPLVSGLLPDVPRIVIPAGDTSKTIETAACVWQGLIEGGATRKSVVVNVGGGMVTDLGGFCASTFKRGVRFVNVPTTLLGAVDAAVGGKTGVNFRSLKNEIGVFREAEAVVISTRFFTTLPHMELMSGFAEMIKHGLLHSPQLLADTLAVDPADTVALLPLLRESVRVKQSVVKADPTERGVRRALNLGHTAGHAFESHAMLSGRAVPHGYAVAWGLVVELVLSRMLAGLPSATLQAVAGYVRENYGVPQIGCDDYSSLLGLMAHDKKNESVGQINFTLMAEAGRPLTGQVVGSETIIAALDIFRDLMSV